MFCTAVQSKDNVIFMDDDQPRVGMFTCVSAHVLAVLTHGRFSVQIIFVDDDQPRAGMLTCVSSHVVPVLTHGRFSVQIIDA